MQTKDYYYKIELVTWYQITVYKLLIFDRNTLNHITICKLSVLLET